MTVDPRRYPDPMRGVVTAAHRRSWEEDGWCILERAIPDDELAAAQHAVTRLFPSAEEMAGASGRDGGPGGGAVAGGGAVTELERWRTWDARWPEFPFRSRSLNRLVVGDVMVELARALLGTDGVRLYLGIATAKYGGQPSDYNQLLHTDFPNHTLTVPRSEAGYQQVETFVYLSDVGPENGATHFVSRSRTRHIPVHQHTLNLEDHGALYQDDADASAPAGSIVAYRPDVYHRSVDFTDPSRSRFMLHASFKPAGMEWGGYQAWPIRGYAAEWHHFVQGATPRQLALLGFPPPGHPFWTAETLTGVAGRYPGLDLTPWQQALDPGHRG